MRTDSPSRAGEMIYFPRSPPINERRRSNLNLTKGLAALLAQHQGQHAVDNELHNYIPPSALKKFWEEWRISQALSGCQDAHGNGPSIPIPTVKRKFLGLLSLLVWINHVEAIEEFASLSITDTHFPLHTFPERWEQTEDRLELYKMIEVHQWKFFPYIFEESTIYYRDLDSRHILPIKESYTIKSSHDNDVVVDIIQVERSCIISAGSEGLGPDGAEHVSLIRKQYIGEDNERLFRRERRAYETLCGHERETPHHIVVSFGSFSQTRRDRKKTYSLILERANGGSLEDLFSSFDRPKNVAQLLEFWESVAGTLAGLRTAQMITRQSGPDELSYEIVHQDIKPSNFLIFREPGSGSHKFLIKLADFGYSFAQRLGPYNEDNLAIKDHGGAQTYSAPENSHHERWTQNDQNRVTPAIDVWAVGCVLSQACVWLAEGPEGLAKYEERRNSELKDHTNLTRAGSWCCFHNGSSRLKEIEQTHRYVERSLPSYDNITPKIIRMVEDEILLSNADSRRHPYALHQRLMSFFANPASPQTRATVPGPTSEILAQPAETATTGLPRAQLQERAAFSANFQIDEDRLQTSQGNHNGKPESLRLSYEDARELIARQKAGGPIYGQAKAAMEVLEVLKENLGDRDFVFFVDNSITMRAHRDEVREALRVYTRLTKQIDNNGIEACFASDPKQVTRYKRTTKLMEDFDKRTWNQVNFENRFSDFIKNRIQRRLPGRLRRGPMRPKPLSIFVLTNGKWGTDQPLACGIERPMNDLINEMMKDRVNASRTQVSIQFMRFGDDPDGKRYLRYLDDLGQSKEMDIIDTKRFDSDVYAMLNGSVHQDEDQKDE